jgi:flagellar biosynthetic protein FliQ
MTTDVVMEIMAETFMTSLIMAGPPLIISLLVGLVVAILQAATQVHEQTLTFVPKLLAIGVTLIVLGPWMMEMMNDFTIRLFDTISRIA